MDLISAERYWLDESITLKIRRNKPAWSGFPQRKFISWPSNLECLLSSRCNHAIPCHMLVEWPTWVATPIPGSIVGFVCRCCNSCAKPDFSFSKVSILLSDSNVHKIQKIGRVVCETASVSPGILWVHVAVFAILVRTSFSPFPNWKSFTPFHVSFLCFEWLNSDRLLLANPLTIGT